MNDQPNNSARENLYQLLLEHMPCEWLDRVQDYFSEMTTQMIELSLQRDGLRAELEKYKRYADENAEAANKLRVENARLKQEIQEQYQDYE